MHNTTQHNTLKWNTSLLLQWRPESALLCRSLHKVDKFPLSRHDRIRRSPCSVVSIDREWREQSDVEQRRRPWHKCSLGRVDLLICQIQANEDLRQSRIDGSFLCLRWFRSDNRRSIVCSVVSIFKSQLDISLDFIFSLIWAKETVLSMILCCPIWFPQPLIVLCQHLWDSDCSVENKSKWLLIIVVFVQSNANGWPGEQWSWVWKKRLRVAEKMLEINWKRTQIEQICLTS